METPELQQQFFNHLKNQLPSHLSLVDELCELLELSTDSVYRRIRGEKPVSLMELKKLCEHYRISLDQVLLLQNDSVVFHAPEINKETIDFTGYLEGLLAYLKYFNSFKQKRILYLCKDVPVFHFYMFPEVAAFKSFFWVKAILNHPAYSNRKFSLQDHDFDNCFKLGNEILKEYNQVPSTELWNMESINSTISQIEYYRDAGVFSSKEDLLTIINSFMKLLDHLELQAEKGVKFFPGATDVSYKASFHLYINEVILGNNSIFVEMDDKRLSFVTYNVINYITTKDQRFNDKSFKNFNTLLSRATLVSGTGERERSRFFNTLREKANKLKQI